MLRVNHRLCGAVAELASADLAGDSAAAEAALRWMSQRGVKNPRALTRMLVAGARGAE